MGENSESKVFTPSPIFLTVKSVMYLETLRA